MDLVISEHQPKDGIAVLSVEGRLNALTASELKDKFRTLVAESVCYMGLEWAGLHLSIAQVFRRSSPV